MATETDLDLMLRVRGGDAGSFEELLRRYRTPLVNYFNRLLRDPALAEDLAQEVFLRVYQARERYQPEAQFSTWLYRIATNLAINTVRDRRDVAPRNNSQNPNEEPATARIVDPRPSAEQHLIASGRDGLIRQALEALPENQRMAVILHKYQEVDYRHIAKTLGVSVSAVKSLLFRAYETLRVRLEPYLKGGRL
jgi:RNA polymerase sigma-70 factor (ECF subfamily)